MTSKPHQERALTPAHLLDIVQQTMDACYRKRSAKTPARSAEEFYGFKAEDVTTVYQRRHGYGRGVWYRLKDNRVFDAAAKPAPEEPEWYQGFQH